MSFDDAPARLDDLLRAIERLHEFVAGKSFDDYRDDILLRMATERCIEIISEASRHIPAALKSRHPEVPWRNIADIGNVLRHAYRAIDPYILWQVATQHTVPLQNAARQMLEEMQGPPPKETTA